MFYYIEYCNKHGEQKSFEYDFGKDPSLKQVDSLILQATIDNEFPNQFALRHVTDIAANASGKNTIRQVMALFLLKDIKYEVRSVPRPIRQKRWFLQ